MTSQRMAGSGSIPIIGSVEPVPVVAELVDIVAGCTDGGAFFVGLVDKAIRQAIRADAGLTNQISLGHLMFG